jgi:hypothetical protein
VHEVDEPAQDVRIRTWQHPVAEVEDVAGTAAGRGEDP